MAHYRGSGRTEDKIEVQWAGYIVFGWRKMFPILWVCLGP